MILLVTPAPSAPDCAIRLHQATGEPVAIAPDLSDALAHLRTSACSLAILDRTLPEAEPLEASTLWAHLESITVVELNLALTSLDHLIREVQSARKRCQHNLASARTNATSLLQAEINQLITGLLLDCDMATQVKELPSAARERLAFIRADAEKLRERLTLPCTN
jgi:hypothetical protein